MWADASPPASSDTLRGGPAPYFERGIIWGEGRRKLADMACAGCGRVNRHDPGSQAGRVCAERIKAGKTRPAERYSDTPNGGQTDSLDAWAPNLVGEVDRYTRTRERANSAYARRRANLNKWAETQRAALGMSDHGNEAVAEAHLERTAADTRGYRRTMSDAAARVTRKVVTDDYADNAARTLAADRAEANGHPHPETNMVPAGFVVNGQRTVPEPYTYPVTPMPWRTEPFSDLPQRTQDAYLEGMIDGREDHERWPDPPPEWEGEAADGWRAGHNLARIQREFASAADYEANEISNVTVDQTGTDGRTYRRTFNDIVFHGDGTFSGTRTEADDPSFIRAGNLDTEPASSPIRVQFQRHQIRSWESPGDFEDAHDEMLGIGVQVPNVGRWR